MRNFVEQANGVSKILKQSGLSMKDKKISEYEVPSTDQDSSLHTANQIWSR